MRSEGVRVLEGPCRNVSMVTVAFRDWFWRHGLVTIGFGYYRFGIIVGILALPEVAAYPESVVKQPFINVEEKIDRFVGRRTRTPDGLKAGMQMQETAAQLHMAFRHSWMPKGVYRFKTHEEADAWMTKMLARSGLATT